MGLNSMAQIECQPYYKYMIPDLQDSYLSENEYFADAAN